MDDDLEDKILYQTFVFHFKKIAKMGEPVTTTAVTSQAYLANVWRFFRSYAFTPEMFLIVVLVALAFVYFQSNPSSRNIYRKVKLALTAAVDAKSPDDLKSNLQYQSGNVAVYAIQGRRSHMEDRFVISENIEDTGVALFAVFDGHGGTFAAEYAKDNLIKNVKRRVVEIKKFVSHGIVEKVKEELQEMEVVEETSEVKPLLKKAASQQDDKMCVRNDFSKKILLGGRNAFMDKTPMEPAFAKAKEASSYVKSDGGINYNMLLTDEVLAADRLLIQTAKKTCNVAGTTAIIALLEGTKLIVANIGDSRGVMCDVKGNAIPLSFDHKPQQMREKKRIEDAGGFVAFNGVWRVAGILATSRALGDYPLKDHKLVIADPDILTFDLASYKPQFLVLASDGLWDIFSNEEAVAYLRDHLKEPFCGAKSITLQAFNNGSIDNITVLVVDLSKHDWSEPKIALGL